MDTKLKAPTVTKTRSKTREINYRQAELVETDKMLALGQLACGIAHEVNNQLGAALGYLQLAREENLFPEEAVEYVARIEERMRQAAKIVNEVREFGAPRLPTFQPLQIKEIIQVTMDLMRVRGTPANITISHELSDGLPPVLGDANRLTQVFLNLLLNAQEAMLGGGEIRIQSRRAWDQVQITVADTGEGIAAENLPHIFEPFFTTKPGRGMGMGLAVSYRIVKEHGGNIEVQSQKGQGTTFTITLPVATRENN